MNGTGTAGAGPQRKSTGNEMSEKLLQGWAMLAMHCPVCFNPILRSRAGEKRCVVCDLPVIEEADAPPQLTSAAPQEPAQQQQGGRTEEGATGWEKEEEAEREKSRGQREGGVERADVDGLVSGTPLERTTGGQQRQDLLPIGTVPAATPGTAAAAAAATAVPSAAGVTASCPVAPLLPPSTSHPASLPAPGTLPHKPDTSSSPRDASMSALNAAANDALIGALRAVVTQLQRAQRALDSASDLQQTHQVGVLSHQQVCTISECAVRTCGHLMSLKISNLDLPIFCPSPLHLPALLSCPQLLVIISECARAIKERL
ncbi:unnamed protein product [Closterium sp. Naga37s-1]|nr:unnamed protein product [Closterium sp. Naga37s-1]